MRTLLIIMCVLAALFTGGCAVLALAAGPLALLPAGVAVLNLAILGVLFKWRFKWQPAFFVLGAIDFIIAAAVLILMGSFASADPNDPTVAISVVFAAFFVLKGIASIVVGLKSQNEI
ncbi:MAG: hypothetical protein ABIN69_01620 [Aestuariivirga sp.]